MSKNLIARNYKKFTFDLVRQDRWGLGFRRKKWLFFRDDVKREVTYNLTLGPFMISVWKKIKRLNV